MLEGEVLLGIHAEFGITMDIQHGNIEVGDGNGPLKIPRLGEGFVGNYQFPPELFMGCRGNLGKKPPIQPFYKLKGPHNHRMDPLGLYDRKGKFLKGGKSGYLPAYDPVIEK
jgi:hypothetical protein